MAIPKKHHQQQKPEERHVTKAEVKAGVQLKAGHHVILYIDGLGGSQPPAPPGPPVTPEPPPPPPAPPEPPAPPAPPPDVPVTPPAPVVPPTPPAPPEPPPAPPPTIAVATLEGIHFEFDKCLPLPSVIATCKAVVKAAAGKTLLVVGHTDDKGKAVYNMRLSENRAKAIQAYLIDDADAWLAFYNQNAAGKTWGTREDQIMLHALPYGKSPYLAAPPDNFSSNAVKAAIKKFQSAAGLEADGKMGNDTRKALIQEYMKAEGTSLPSGAPISSLPCGQHHPPAKGADDDANWRRVEVFLFDGEIKPPADGCRNAAHPGCTVHDAWLKESKPLSL